MASETYGLRRSGVVCAIVVWCSLEACDLRRSGVVCAIVVWLAPEAFGFHRRALFAPYGFEWRRRRIVCAVVV